MVEYREIFLNEMKSLLPYFVEFFDDGSILPKLYSENCTMDNPDQRPIIMITYNESIFFANDGQ